jgi:putative transposase
VVDRRLWIERDHQWLSVREQCQLLEVNRSSLYDSAHPRELSDEQLKLMRLVDEIYTRYPFFGTQKMSDYISHHHLPVDRRSSSLGI